MKIFEPSYTIVDRQACGTKTMWFMFEEIETLTPMAYNYQFTFLKLVQHYLSFFINKYWQESDGSTKQKSSIFLLMLDPFEM